MQNESLKPIRVLHVLGGLERGGAETMVMNLYRCVDRQKVQFDFVIHTEARGAYYDEIVSLGGTIFSCPRYNGKNHFNYVKWWRSFLSDHAEYRIVHGHVRSTASIYLKIARGLGRYAISHSHSTSSGKGISALVKNILQHSIRYNADYFMACSAKSARWLFGKKVAEGTKCKLISNAIISSDFKYNEAVRDKYRAEMGLSDKLVFVHVGRLHPAKNHPFLLEVFKAITANHPEAVLLVIGDGELKADVEAKIKDLKLEESVRMLGSRGDVPALLSASDCFLFPSLWEGVPLTVVEAQAAGLPCLVSDRVTDDVNISDLVIRLPIDQGADLWAEKLSALDFSRPNVLDEIINAGYDVEKNAEWLEEFYLKIIA